MNTTGERVGIRNWRDARQRCGPLGALSLAVYHFGHRAYSQQGSRRGIKWRVFQVLDVVVIRACAGARLPAQATIGRRLSLPHDGNGVVIHAATVIGDDVKIFHGVTIGALLDRNQEAPVIGDGVVIGAGACILGPVRIGPGAVIGANAVVLQDVPAGATAVGIPARIVIRDRS